MKTENSAGAIIFYIDKKNNEPKFLLLKYTNYWGFVKGLIEKNEKVEETIVREAKEEANLNDLRFLPEFKFEQNWFYKLNNELIKKSAFFLLAEVSEEDSKKAKISFEHEELRWLDFNEAMSLMKIKNNKEMLEKAYKFIKENKQKL